ncbi:MAG: CDP-diacylglycerol--serine O-phosphatidyltransferase [Acidiferrobacterales bacterium]|nr:CDP-diacylglycerol--serine O-phosphatidyltransferase [Acidiferrobacterales bacterium]
MTTDQEKSRAEATVNVSSPKHKNLSKSSTLRDSKRRGIYVLPNLLTTGALFFGFFSVIQATQQKFEIAAIAILIATVLDGLDGRVARLTKTSSLFGKEYDSLSDVICFGLAPALIVYEWTLHAFGKIGWLGAFLFVSATALRLARFNTISSPNPAYFQGLPCPMAAAFLVTWMWVMVSPSASQFPVLSEVTFFIVVMLALLMVSSIPYLSFKNFGVKGRVPFIASIVIVLAIAVVSIDPPRVLFAVCLIYLVSGAIIWMNGNLRRRARIPAGGDGSGD